MEENKPFWKTNDTNFEPIKQLLQYRRNWYWFAVSLLLFIGLGYAYISIIPPTYKVSATVLIKDDKKSLGGSSEILDELSLLGGNKNVENEIEMLRSRNLIRNVVQKLNLTTTYWKEGKVIDQELFQNLPITAKLFGSPRNKDINFFIQTMKKDEYRLYNEDETLMGSFNYDEIVIVPSGRLRVSKNKDVQYSQKIKLIIKPEAKVIEELIGNLSVELLNPKSTVIKLGQETNIPEQGVAIMTKQLEEYTYGSLTDKGEEAGKMLKFIEERLNILVNELEKVEEKVENYRTSNNLTDLSSEATLFLENAKTSDIQFNEVDVRLKSISSLEEILSREKVGELPNSAFMIDDPALVGTLSKLTELELEKSKLANVLQPDNPSFILLNKQIIQIRQSILERIKNKKKELIIVKNNISEQSRKIEGIIKKIPQKEREYVAIKRQASIKESLYLLLLKKQEETAISYASTVTDTRIVDEPEVSFEPIKPKKGVVMALCGILGMILPIVLLALKDYLTTTVQSKEDISTIAGLKTFGEIGEVTDKIKKGTLINLKGRSFVSEQIRMIRSNLQFILDENDASCKTILFTSSISGEGKSFVSANIAASLGLLDKKVIALELDLRKPKLHDYLGVENTKGITNYIVQNAKLSEVVQKTSSPNLDIITSGPLPPNPSELLNRNAVATLFNELKKQYDYIIVDTAPMNLVTDATLLAKFIDACIYIVRSEKTPKQFMNNVKEISKSGVYKSFYVVLNGINYRKNKEYGYGYYGDNTYYGK